MSPTPQRHDRRTFLRLGAGVGAAAALSACTLNNPFTSDKTPAAEAVADLPRDVATAVGAVGLLRTAAANLAATTTRHAGLATPLNGLAKTYAAHLAALTDAVPDGIDTAPPKTRPAPKAPRAAELLAVKDAEGLHLKLVDLAVAAESGPFARLLGTMSAGLSQQVAVLTTQVPR